MSERIVASRPGFTQATRAQVDARAAQQAREVGMRIHLADVTLDQARDVPWSQLPEAERRVYDERGALALRLTDPVAVAVARHHATLAAGELLGVQPHTLNAAAAALIPAFIAALSAQKGGR